MTETVKVAVVLAGGLGTRLRAVVPDRPKPMALLSGRPFLEFLLDYWIGQGVEEFILSVGYRHEMIQSHFGDAYRSARIRYAIEATPQGTGGGVLGAVAGLTEHENCLLLNGDTYFAVPLRELVTQHFACRSDWTFSLFRSDDDQRYMGMKLAKDGQVLELAAAQDTDQMRVNGGVYLFRPSLLLNYAQDGQGPVSLEQDLLPRMLKDEVRMYGQAFAAAFIDIGVPEDYARAEGVISAGCLPDDE